MPDTSRALKETSSRSLSGVDMINSGSQTFRLHEKENGKSSRFDTCETFACEICREDRRNDKFLCTRKLLEPFYGWIKPLETITIF